MAIPYIFQPIETTAPEGFTPNQWVPCADLVLFTDRQYYKATARRWDAEGKTCAQVVLPLEFPTAREAVQGAIELILLLMRQAKSGVAKRVVPGYRRKSPGDQLPLHHCITIGEGLTPAYANALSQSILEIVHGHTNSVWFAIDPLSLEYIAYTPIKEISRGTDWQASVAAVREWHSKLPAGTMPPLEDSHAAKVKTALDQQLAAAKRIKETAPRKGGPLASAEVTADGATLEATEKPGDKLPGDAPEASAGDGEKKIEARDV